MVTDKQVLLYRRIRMEGKTQEAAAASSNMSVRTGREWELGALPSQAKKKRDWRTHEDAFAKYWDDEILPLLQADKVAKTEGKKRRKLQAKTIFDALVERHPGVFESGQLRSLQRQVRDWRALNGSPKEVFFPQEHPPGREGVYDFTHCDSLEVTIAGVLFAHLLFTFRLSHSSWTWVQLAFSETFEALISGIQGALWALGGVTEVIRHDNLSAATHELAKAGGRTLNARYRDFLEHYGLKSTRIKPGKPNENGVAEKGNDLIKTALEQALILRGSREFPSVDAYMALVHRVIERMNASRVTKIDAERAHLNALPARPVPTFTVHTPKVRKWSTIQVAGRTYSVPSRLIGHEVRVHQHADVLEVFYNDTLTATMPRLRGKKGAGIDYRHIIWSLVRKPGAFARYRFREELFPSLTFRKAYDALVKWRGERADLEYVRILHLAAATMESEVECALELLLEGGERFDYAALKDLAQPEAQTIPHIQIPEPDLAHYDALIGAA